MVPFWQCVQQYIVVCTSIMYLIIYKSLFRFNDADHLPEWSIGWRSGRHVFVLVGSNPTVVIDYIFSYGSVPFFLL